MMPSVFSYSSTPLYLERSQRPADQRGVRLGHVARQRGQQRHRVLGGGDHVGLGRVGHHDAAPRGGVHVHVVHADAGTADGLEVVGLVDQVGGELGGGADEHAVELADAALELAVLPVGAQLDVEARRRAAARTPAVADLLLRPGPASCRQLLHHPVDARRERLDVVRLDGGEHADPQLVAAQLAVGLGVDDAVGAQRRPPRRRRPPSRRSRSCPPPASAWRARPRTAWRTPTPRPSRRGARTTRWCGPRRSPAGRRRRSSSRPARPAATGWPPPACCRSGPCASSPARWSATGSRGSSGRPRRSARSARSRRGCSSGEPDAAVGREALLRGEVVDVGLGGVQRQPAGARGGVDRAPARRRRAASTPHHHAGRGLVVGPGDHVAGRVGAWARARRRARPRPPPGRPGTARPR